MPLLVIDGKPVLYKHVERYCCVQEVLPDPVTFTRCYKPGPLYSIVWYRDGRRELIPGAAVRTVRPSGREMLNLTRSEVAA